MEERNVIERLNALEDRIADARRRKARAQDPSSDPNSANQDTTKEEPPHTLPPQRLMSAHLIPLHISQQSQLNAKLQTTQSQNASLMETIRKQRQEIEALLAQGEAMVHDVDVAGGKISKKGNTLSEQARGAEQVMANY